MGHDEDTNNFNGGTTPVTPNPRAQLGNNRLGMQKSRDFSAADELNRIVEAEQKENIAASGGDIVLAPVEKPKKDKKVIIIAVLFVAVIIVFGVGFFVKGGVASIINGNSSDVIKNNLSSAVNNYSEKIIELENMAHSVREGRTTAEDSFTEDIKKRLNEDFSALESMKSEINSNNDGAPEVKALSEQINQVEPMYQEFVTIYNDYYKAFTDFDKTSIEKYLDKGENIKAATEAYIGYINNHEIISQNESKIKQLGCEKEGSLTASKTQECNTLINETYDAKKALRNGEYFKTIFAGAIGNMVITETNSLSGKIIALKGYLGI